jgi:hypothetical protein
LALGIHDNTEDFQGNGDMAANEVLVDILGNLPLFTLCDDSSIWERLLSIGQSIGTKAEFLLPMVCCCQRGLRKQSNVQERLYNFGILETLGNRFVDLRMEVVFQVGLAAIRNQG